MHIYFYILISRYIIWFDKLPTDSIFDKLTRGAIDKEGNWQQTNKKIENETRQNEIRQIEKWRWGLQFSATKTL